MKKLLVLLLAIVMCLSFAACDSNGGTDDDEPSKGEKLYKKYKEIINYMEDGQYAAAYELIASLAGESNPGDTNGNAYAEIIEHLNNGNYAAAIQAIVEMSNQNDPNNPPTDLKALLNGNWYAYQFSSEADPVAMEAVFSEDGSCTVNGENLSWMVTWEGDTSLDMQLYKDGVHVYNASLRTYESGVSYVGVWNAQDGDSVGSFYNHALMPFFMASSWRILDTTNTTVEYYSVNVDEIYVDNEDWKYVIASADGDDRLVLHVYSENPESPEYILALYFRDGYPVVDATETATNTTCLYYSSYAGGYSQDWPEYIYPRAMDYLESGRDGSFNAYDENGNWLSGNKALARIYDLFVQCGNYKDSQEHVERFTILKDMLVDVNVNRVDNLGNSYSRDWEYFEYDSTGRYTYTSSYSMNRFLFGYLDNSYSMRYVYDENGALVEIYEGSATSKSGIYTPTFDANGNMVSLECRTNNGTWTNTYTYDENGKIQSAMYYSYSQTSSPLYTTTFTYDAEGQLIQEVIKCNNLNNDYYNLVYTIDYTYDANGHIATEVHTNNYSWDSRTDYTVSYTYTCDEEGDPISAVMVDSSETQYTSEILEYIYEDLYYYAFEN